MSDIQIEDNTPETFESLMSQLGNDFPAEDAAEGEEATTPAAEDTAAPTTQEDPTEPKKQRAAPGDLKVALHQERTARQAEAARVRDLEQRLADIESRNQQAHRAAQLQEQLAVMDPEQVPHYLEAVRQAEAQQMQQTLGERETHLRAQLSVGFVKQANPDFDAQMAKLQAMGGAVNWQAFDRSENPAQAAYDFARQYQTPEERDAAFKAEVQAEVQAQLAKLTGRTVPKQPQAPRGIGKLPASAPNVATGPDISKHLDALDKGGEEGNRALKALLGMSSL